MNSHVRAVLVAIHLVAITAGSLPVLVDERLLTVETWESPVARKEFQGWSESLRRLGVQRTPEEVGNLLWGVAEGLLRAQRALQRPFLAYYREAGTRQRWRMFPAAVDEMPRFRVDLRVEQGWNTLYRMGDPAHAWGGEHFDRDRFRAALNLYAWGLHPQSYEQLVAWIGARAPGEGLVRVGFEALPAISSGDGSQPREVRSWPEEKLVREWARAR